VSYPPDYYRGEKGEISATYRPAGAEPELTIGQVTIARYLATGGTTHGQFGLYRWDMGPQPVGPSPHFHRAISESFYILSGTVRLYDGDKWFDAHPGDFIYVPEGGIHAFRNESGEPASMLLHFAPGAPREPYFEALADAAASGRALGPEELTELWLRHDTYPVSERPAVDT
jgi:mannose-6-phosphate isomerase-like protein (cupin superfamily)